MRARRVDLTQSEIVFALRKVGCRVLHLHTIGQGCPDLLVSTPTGHTVLMECKSPGGKLTPDQEAWFDDWPGQIVIVTNAQQALDAVGVKTQQPTRIQHGRR